jgi:TrmH family RNA methyltransferase
MEETIITSVQNARIKHVVALQQKSSLRREEGLFVVEGQREIEHCKACGYEIVEEYIRDVNVTSQVYEKMAYRGSTEGIIAVAKCKDHSLATLKLKENPLIVILESVEKPGNLGAVLRSAEASGVDAVIVCDPLTDMYNPNLIRASIGGVFSVPTAVCTSQECIAFLKENGIKILTAQLQDSYEYYDYDMRPATAIVMGTESTGLTDQWRKAADAHIRIPMLGRLDSLNVSVSAAILMYEALRQRRMVKR